MRSVPVSHDTRCQLLLTFTVISLALLPLQNNILPYFFPWATLSPDYGWLILIVLAGFYVFCLRRGGDTFSSTPLLVSFGLTFLLFMSIAGGTVQPASLPAGLRFFVLIWLIPLFVYLLRGVRVRRLFLLSLLTVIVLQAQWGIVQFVLQRDLGFQLVGESDIAAGTAGVAKFAGPQGKLIRAYGPYAHSNTFGGVMLVGFLVLIFAGTGRRVFTPPAFFGIFATLLLGLLMSFSRTAYAGFVWLGLICAIPGFFAFKKTVHVKRILLLGMVIVLTCSPLLYYRFTDTDDSAAADRVAGAKWAYDLVDSLGLTGAGPTLLKLPAVAPVELWPARRGAGPGNYTAALEHFLLQRELTFHRWQIEPIHNVPLMFLLEFGVVPFAAILFLAVFLARRLGWDSLWLTVFVPPFMLDHYFYSQLAPAGLLLVMAVSLIMSHKILTD